MRWWLSCSAVDDGVAELADAELQRAAVAHERRRVQADGVVRGAERQVRRRKQVVVVAAGIDEKVEAVGGNLRGAEA